MENKTPQEFKIPQVQLSEIREWEEKFKQNVSPLVVFDQIGENGESFKFYKGVSGIEIEWSGVIKMAGDEFIKWKFSILYNVYIESKFHLDGENKNVIRNIFDFYIGWSQYWSQALSDVKDMHQELRENRTKENIIKLGKDRMSRLAGLKY